MGSGNAGGTMRNLACEPGTEISGVAMLSLIENVRGDALIPLVKKHGLEDIDSARWYPAENYLDFLNDLVRHPDLMFNLVAIGMSIAEIGLMPPGLENATFPQMVEKWDQHYQANFRNGDVGNKTTVQVDRQHYKIVHNKTVIPDDFEYGVLYGFAKRFLPPGTQFTVWFDEDTPRMDEGGEQTIIHVQWE
jgi:hypothetical protein